MDIHFVDIQGFGDLNSNRFILKEVAVLHNENHHHHFIVSPPFNLSLTSDSLRRQVNWLYHNYHGLTWNGGFAHLSQVKIFLREKLQSGVVYVKGIEKKQWLQTLLNNENVEVVNLEEDIYYRCPNLKELKKMYPNITSKCGYHGKICALQNVYLLSKFISEAKNCNL